MRAKTTMLCTSQHLISLTISIHQMISICTHQYGIRMSPFSPPMLHSNRSFSQNETCGTFCCLSCYLLFIYHIRVVRSQQNKRNENLTSLDIYFQLIKKKKSPARFKTKQDVQMLQPSYIYSYMVIL